MEVQRIEEYMIGADLKASIRGLLSVCFPQYPENQTFIGQAPHFRMLLFQHTGYLTGHIAVGFRRVNNGGKIVSVFALSDVCVHPDFQQRGGGTRLLTAIEALGRQFQIPFLLLISAEPAWYAHRGFVPVNEPLKWLVIRNGHSLGVVSRRVTDALMVKPISEETWLPGSVDFLGSIF